MTKVIIYALEKYQANYPSVYRHIKNIRSSVRIIRKNTFWLCGAIWQGAWQMPFFLTHGRANSLDAVHVLVPKRAGKKNGEIYSSNLYQTYMFLERDSILFWTTLDVTKMNSFWIQYRYIFMLAKACIYFGLDVMRNSFFFRIGKTN